MSQALAVVSVFISCLTLLAVLDINEHVNEQSLGYEEVAGLESSVLMQAFMQIMYGDIG